MKSSRKLLLGMPVLLWIVLVYGLSRPLGPLPALGPLLNPFSGLWQTPKFTEIKPQKWQLPGLLAPVSVLWDEARVPHIVAKNDHDLAWAQGFVHASQRLFQMDLQARAGGARLSELVGARTIKLDKYYIRIGMRHAVNRSVEWMMSDAETKLQLTAYADGVNAWIGKLKPVQLPSEYRLLNKKPQLWSPVRAAEFFVVMSYRLAGRTFDLPLTYLQKKYGSEKVRSLFPEFMPADLEQPIYQGFVPKNLKTLPEFKSDFVTSLDVDLDLIQPFVSNGSNNWAVSPSLSATGSSLLANDTHLGFSLPGMWFEQQLISPSMNVYGGGFAGVPGVMSGFTPTTAWAVTNGTTDVFDWYEVQFRDSESLEYKTAQGWKLAQVEDEKIKVHGQNEISQPVVWTEWGPVFVRQGQKGLVSRWIVQDGGDAVAIFRKVNQAKNYKECVEALKGFRFPVQNFICTDRNQIGIVHAGAIPLRARGQGQMVMDAQDPLAHWQGFLNSEQTLKIENPKNGFVSSANQRPVDTTFPVSLGWEAENSYRGRHIVELLKNTKQWTADNFISMQINTLNPLARSVLPKMLPLLRDLNKQEQAIASKMAAWDFLDQLDSSDSSVFYNWWAELRSAIWQDQLGENKKSVWPRDERLELLIRRTVAGDNSDQEWIDNIETDKRESLSEILTITFKSTLQKLTATYGASMGDWSWSTVRKLHLPHVARLPGLDRALMAPGSRHAINSMQTEHGPTWRMVVELGETPQAWTSVQGSSSGEPFSVNYDLGLNEWAKGLYKNVVFVIGDLELYKRPGRTMWDLQPGVNK